MAKWSAVAESAPEFAARVRKAFEAHTYKILATLRADGSPRLSGIEADFVGDDLWFGSMPRAMKARDLLRDPRFALHSTPAIDLGDGPEASPGDAKVSGSAIEVADRAEIVPLLTARGASPDAFPDSHFFRLDIDEVVLTSIDGSTMIIEVWRPGQGVRRHTRT
ncbi:pyridoxamine 5'-phosphate oxidase family protein [Goodfellowiella coeruleoviolacea]|uniref:Pyridoxamine 5'-phosphate oxidase n=1 Tax=Goodfellowiella coeruleoviolacea TaxID=334858 RepID=A0AAE3KFY4_9PSEU|nr:pyridoxamine 5'-phosphate oxidase family protein [Goodfellowiella coeruleoviolacea]MCP2166821.1 Pyridoxamine 5'-phosphate oxidase [Goodfellowiella coeruleoviolacea]